MVPPPLSRRSFVRLGFTAFSAAAAVQQTSLSFFTCSQERITDALTGSAVPADASNVCRKMQSLAPQYLWARRRPPKKNRTKKIKLTVSGKKCRYTPRQFIWNTGSPHFVVLPTSNEDRATFTSLSLSLCLLRSSSARIQRTASCRSPATAQAATALYRERGKTKRRVCGERFWGGSFV